MARTGETFHIQGYAYDGFARGRTYWNDDITPLHDDAGQCYAVMLTLTETTAQVLAQQRLEETNTVLTAINALALRVNATKDLPTIFQYALDTLIELLHLDQGVVGIVNFVDRTFRLVADRLPRQLRQDTPIPLDGTFTLRAIEEYTCPVVIEDVASDPRLLPLERTIFGANGARALLLVPILVESAWYGVMVLHATSAPRTFTVDEIALSETISNQLAVAIRNAQLYEQTQQRMIELVTLNDELEALREVGLAMTGTLDLPAVLRRVLAEIARVVPYQQGMICLDVPERGMLRIEAATGSVIEPLLGTEMRIDQSMNGFVYTQGETVCVDDFWESDEWLTRSHRINVQPDELHSVLCAPLRIGGQSIGTMYLAHGTPAIYHAEDIDRIERYSSQVAVAVANARLFAQVQRQVDELRSLNSELETMHEIGMAVSASLDPAVVLPRVLSEIRQIIPAESGYVTLLESDGETLRIVGDFGFDTPRTGERMPVGKSINGQIITSRRTFRIGDVWADPAWQVTWHNAPAQIAPRMRNLLGTPLIVAGAVIGTLYLVHSETDIFTERDESRLEQYAAQTAIAVANARLYEQIQAQVAALHRLNGDLEAASQHKSDFLATMSHELRTPLNAIIGFSELLADDIVIAEDERRECLMDIHSSARHLLSLINDVLDVAKIESGRMEMHPVAFVVTDELREAERVMAPLILNNRQTLSVAVAPTTPHVYADRARFRQIVLNVLSNATKFTPEGGSITVEVAGSGDQVCIRITDTGIGIRPEDAAKVFEAFRQIDGSLSRRYNGTGLGLALTQRLVELQGGTIGFESEPGVGTMFTITLPVVREVLSAEC